MTVAYSPALTQLGELGGQLPMSTYHAAGMAEQALPGWSPRSWFLYVILPVLMLAAILGAAYVGGPIGHWVFESPIGVQESGIGALALAAAVVTLIAFFQPAIRHNWKVRGWLIAFVAAMVYFAGEDLNWGQYYIGWATPEYFQLHNKENETNLHNISSWFNQKPRLMVELWLLIACIAVPLGWSLPQRLTSRAVPAMFWPDGRLVLIAAMALLVLATDWLSKRGLIPRTLRWSEVEEIYFAYGWLIYSFLLLGRVRQRRRTMDA
jgi:hypothetical protein